MCRRCGTIVEPATVTRACRFSLVQYVVERFYVNVDRAPSTMRSSLSVCLSRVPRSSIAELSYLAGNGPDGASYFWQVGVGHPNSRGVPSLVASLWAL
jgi:hypothetical protein